MHPTWPMVFGALLAGALGGFIVPDKPRSQPTPAVSENTSSKPAPLKAKREIEAAQTEDESIRSVPLTKTATTTTSQDTAPATSQDTAPAPAQKPLEAEAPAGCAIKTWPYRIAGCFDRSAPATTASTVNVKRVDPAATMSAEAPPKSEAPAPKQEAAAPKQKVVTAPPPPQRQENRPETAAAPAPEPARAEAIRPAAASEPQQREVRRPQRQISREVEFDDGIPTRIYRRGPDGRLYLAPEYRPAERQIYYVR